MRVTLLLLLLATGTTPFAAEPVELSSQWTILHRPVRASSRPRELAANGPLKPLPNLQFTGPGPAHPFVLGNYVADGKWGVVQGGVQLAQGHSAALLLAERASNFEIEGRIAMKDYGGWFMLLGWDQESGNGYVVYNCMLKESGSPWFIAEMRGREAVEGTNQELKSVEWNRTQDARISVRDGKLSFELGRLKVFDGEELPNYRPGQVVFGVYDTRYGPRPVRIESLRIRSVPGAAASPPEDPNAGALPTPLDCSHNDAPHR